MIGIVFMLFDGIDGNVELFRNFLVAFPFQTSEVNFPASIRQLLEHLVDQGIHFGLDYPVDKSLFGFFRLIFGQPVLPAAVIADISEAIISNGPVQISFQDHFVLEHLSSFPQFDKQIL